MHTDLNVHQVLDLAKEVSYIGKQCQVVNHYIFVKYIQVNSIIDLVLKILPFLSLILELLIF
jgi:hypothetical protein